MRRRGLGSGRVGVGEWKRVGGWGLGKGRGWRRELSNGGSDPELASAPPTPHPSPTGVTARSSRPWRVQRTPSASETCTPGHPPASSLRGRLRSASKVTTPTAARAALTAHGPGPAPAPPQRARLRARRPLRPAQGEARAARNDFGAARRCAASPSGLAALELRPGGGGAVRPGRPEGSRGTTEGTLDWRRSNTGPRDGPVFRDPSVRKSRSRAP